MIGQPLALGILEGFFGAFEVVKIAGVVPEIKLVHPGPVKSQGAKDIAGAFRNYAPGTAAEFKVARNALEKSPSPFGFVRARAKC